jgi:hypothetical protein
VRRARPHRIRAPDDAVGAEAREQHAHQRGAPPRLHALVGHLRRRRLGLARGEDLAIDRVHRHEGGGHAGSGLKEAPARQALPRRQPVGHGDEPHLHFLLLARLRLREILVARHDLRRHRRGKCRLLGGEELVQLLAAQHRQPSSC